MFFHEELKLALSIYVDDFKLAGPTDALAKGWALLLEKIELEDPGPVGLYLGCQQQRLEVMTPQGVPLGVMIYDMEAFLDQCIAKYLSCPGARPLSTAHTPFLTRTEAVGPIRAAAEGGWDPNWRGDGELKQAESRLPADVIVARNEAPFVPGELLQLRGQRHYEGHVWSPHGAFRPAAPRARLGSNDNQVERDARRRSPSPHVLQSDHEALVHCRMDGRPPRQGMPSCPYRR